MGFLPDYTKGFDYNYLSSDLIEFIRTAVLSNSSKFILQNRSLRIRWIKTDIGFLFPIDWEGGLLKSIGSWIIDAIFFGVFRKNLIDNIDSYRKHGKLAFSTENEALFEATLKNRINWWVLGWADKYVKRRLKKIHDQEESRRKSSFEKTIIQIANPISVEEAVLLNYESLKLFSVTEFIYISHWEYEQIKILIKRIDRTFQRFIPNQTIELKEVACKLHDKLDELAKQIDSMEKASIIDNTLKETKVHEIELFQLQSELQFYNHYYNYIYEQDLMNKEEVKKPEDVGYVSQQNLMIYYLLEYNQLIRPDVSSTRYGKFVRFLTGMSIHSIRKGWPQATFQKNNPLRKRDLRKIKEIFKEIKADEIIKMIDNDLALKFRTRWNRDGTNG